MNTNTSTRTPARTLERYDIKQVMIMGAANWVVFDTLTGGRVGFAPSFSGAKQIARELCRESIDDLR